MKIILPHILTFIFIFVLLMPGCTGDTEVPDAQNITDSFDDSYESEVKPASGALDETAYLSNISLPVLLAYEETRFKSGLIEKMKSLIEAKGLKVEVVLHSERDFTPGSPEKYSAIFISNSGVNSEVRPWIISWLNSNISHGDKILLHTTQNRDWVVDVDIDAITSASAIARTDELAAKYVNRLLGIIMKRQGE